MQFPAVHWHEGLFLQPHHFQAWDRHWSERVATGEQWQNPYSYGIAEISINSAALAAGYIQLDRLRAKTPGGTLLQLTTGQQSERYDLRNALQFSSGVSGATGNVDAKSGVDVHIGVPSLRLGGPNVAQANTESGNRFSTELLELPDETDASSVQPVELRRVNAKILVSGDDLAGYDSLKVARIRIGADGSSLELDPQFIPPLIDCAAWPSVRTQILSPISDLLLRASEQAGQALADASKSLTANSSLQLQRLLLLQAVNPAASVLRVFATSRGIHPQIAYCRLAELAGSLDIFHPQRSVKETRPYDHENLGPLFLQLKQRIVAALSTFDSKPYFQKFLIGNEFGLQTTIDHVPADGRCEWFVGVLKGNLPIDALQQLLSPGHLDWKIGGAHQVEWLFTHRAPGVELEPATELPPVLPRNNEWAYFRVGQNSPAWKEVLASKTLAVRIKDSLIANPEALPGKRQLEVRHGGQIIPLQFALFAVS